MSRIHYSACPVCESADIHPLLTVKDYSVSKEDFVVWQCGNCTLRFTQDVPDENSIGPYYQSQDYISHTNTNKGLLNKLYQKVRNRTLEKKAKLIVQYTKPAGKILDVGAGVGAFLHVMRQKKWTVTGIEPDEGARKIAEDSFAVQLQEPSTLQKLTRGFDAITLWHVLEHVHELHPYIQKLKELLADNGKIFIAVPNYKSLDADIYRLNWAAYDVPRHLYHFSPKSMNVLMEKHGLKIIEKKRMWYDSFYISLLSSKYRKGKTSWLSAGINGLRSNIKALFKTDACSSLIYIIERKLRLKIND